MGLNHLENSQRLSTLLRITIPKWALPKEIIPISVEWPKDIVWNYIEVHLPPEVVLEDLANIEEFNFDEQKNILKIKKTFEPANSELNLEYSYFVVEVSTPIIEDITKQYPVRVIQYADQKIINEISSFIRIFRPRVDFFNMPGNSIILDDTKQKGTFTFRLKLSGFGDTRFRIQIATRGQIRFKS